MDRLVPALYKSYGLYTNQRKMLPKIIDGLLPVQRRVLLTCHLTCKRDWKKTAAVLGETMSRFHPHSEATGTAELLVQNGFADGWGQWGTKIGVEPINCAAMRYTKIRANKFIEEIAFKYVDHVKWEEDEMDPEPVALPTMIPFCLMMKYELSSIAFGFRTDIPCYTIKNLSQRLLYLLGQEKQHTIYPNIFQCKVISGEFEKILQYGTGNVDIQGLHKRHKRLKKVEVNGWSPRITFPGLLKKIDNYKKWGLLSNGDIGYNDQTGKGNNQTKVMFKIIKQRNTDKIYKRMTEAIIESLKASISYNIYVIDETSKVILSNVDDMLRKSFDYYLNAFELYTDDMITKINSTINEYGVIDKIRPFISDAINNHKSNTDKAIAYISSKSGVSLSNIQSVVEKYRIKKLMSVKTDISELKKDVVELKKQLKNSKTICVDMYKQLVI